MSKRNTSPNGYDTFSMNGLFEDVLSGEFTNPYEFEEKTLKDLARVTFDKGARSIDAHQDPFIYISTYSPSPQIDLGVDVSGTKIANGVLEIDRLLLYREDVDKELELINEGNKVFVYRNVLRPLALEPDYDLSHFSDLSKLRAGLVEATEALLFYKS